MALCMKLRASQLAALLADGWTQLSSGKPTELECLLACSGGSGSSTCCDGECGDLGVPTGLAGTVTDADGCLTDVPSSMDWTCIPSLNAGKHAFRAVAFDDYCGINGSGSNWTIDCAFDPTNNEPVLRVETANMFGAAQFLFIHPEPGWTCAPFSAVYLVADDVHNRATVTVVE